MTSRQLRWVGLCQERWLNRHGKERITLPAVAGTSARFGQRPYEASTDKRGSNMKLTRRTYSVRLIHMRGGTAAIPEA